MNTTTEKAPSETTANSGRRRGFLSRDYLFADVNPDLASGPLAAYCFMTGFTGVVGFSAIYVWVGFQTGNTSQLAMAIARLFEPQPGGGHDFSFHIADQQALCSLLTFLGGAFLGRIGDRMGAKTRAWLFLGTLLQAAFTMASAVTVWQSQQTNFATNRGDPSWTNTMTFATIGFLSAGIGLQGIMGKRVNTQFATTIVLTTVWCELMADPKLFDFRHLVKSRDHKVIGVVSLFIGAFIGRTILQFTSAGGTLGVGTGIRILIAFWWLFVPAKAPKQQTEAKGDKPGGKEAS